MPPISSWFSSKRLVPTSDIGVDLGTANTLACVRGEGVVLNEPSVVAVEMGTKRIMSVGLEAKRMLGRTPEGIEAVRPLRDGVIADVDVTELMLRHFLKQVMAKRIFRIKPRVVVGVPSGITELERRAVRSSAQAAGANEVYVVAEPMAAAIGVGLPIDTPRGNMVIDIGGGTTEIAVIALAGIVSDTSIRVGGDELDRCIVTFLRTNYNLLVGEPTAEAIKMQIGSAMDTGEEREMVPSPKVATYDLQPEMSAAGVCDKVVRGIDSGSFELIVVNFANGDMVGHTGVIEAAVRACQTVDGCLARIEQALKVRGGQWIVTADHGNADLMVDPETGAPHTYHTTFPVPLVLIGDHRGRLADGGSLRDISPTILGCLGVDQPAEMTGRNLCQNG